MGVQKDLIKFKTKRCGNNGTNGSQRVGFDIPRVQAKRAGSSFSTQSAKQSFEMLTANDSSSAFRTLA
jgi:hypothetical protein